MPGGLGPDLVWYRVCPVAEPGGGLGERQRGAFGIGELGRLSPSRHCENALICFTCLLEVTGVHVDADTAAIDLARAQADKFERLQRRAALFHSLPQGQ